MIKLSRTQLAMLRKFAEGDKLCEMHGLHVRLFWFGTYDGPGINYKTVYKLRGLGFIAGIESDWRSTVYTITETGRQFLAEQGGNVG